MSLCHITSERSTWWPTWIFCIPTYYYNLLRMKYLCGNIILNNIEYNIEPLNLEKGTNAIFDKYITRYQVKGQDGKRPKFSNFFCTPPWDFWCMTKILDTLLKERRHQTKLFLIGTVQLGLVFHFNR